MVLIFDLSLMVLSFVLSLMVLSFVLSLMVLIFVLSLMVLILGISLMVEIFGSETHASDDELSLIVLHFRGIQRSGAHRLLGSQKREG